MSPISTFKLIDNPFSATPPGHEKPIIWAGREEIKKTITEVIKNSFISSPSRINVFWGEWGSGKTHSMRYFSQKNVLVDISKEITTKHGLPLTIFCPRDSILDSMYILIIKEISLDRIRKVVEKIANEGQTLVDPTTQRARIKKYGFSEELSIIFQRLISGNQSIRSVAERYIYLESTSADLKKLEVPRRIQTKVEQVELLTQLLRLMISDKSEYSRIFLWIDEMETIENLSGKDLMDLRSFIRSLIDFVPNGLTLMLNGTFRADDELDSFFDYLGPAVRDRLFKVIPYPFLNENEAKAYVKGLLNDPVYRTEENKRMLESKNMSYFPFDETCVENVFRKLSDNLKRSPTPRNINDALATIMEYCVQNKQKMESLGRLEEVIDSTFLEGNWNNIKLGIISIK